VSGLEEHPCVSVDPTISDKNDDYLIVGNYVDGGTANLTPIYVTCTGAYDVLLSYKPTQGNQSPTFSERDSERVRWAMAGAPVLNLSTGSVCAILTNLTHPDDSAARLALPWGIIIPGSSENQDFHDRNPHWADVLLRHRSSADQSSHEPGADLETITTRREFGQLLRGQKLAAGFSTPHIAARAHVSESRAASYFIGRHLPKDSKVLDRILQACDVRSSWQLGRWNRAFNLVWSMPVESGEKHAQQGNDEPGLLFRMYIPSQRLYAAEAHRLLSLFRDWLIATHGHGIRQDGYHTASGEIYEFFMDSSAMQLNLGEQIDGFSNFLALCSQNPSAAIDLLAPTTLGRASSTALVARFGREVRRLQIDLRHERERRILTLRHSLEEELLDSGIELGQVPYGQINNLIERLVPGPSASESLALLTTLPMAQPTVSVNINPQIISAVESTIIQNVQGTVNVSPQAKEALALIHRFGGQETASLESALYELEDEDAPRMARSAAKTRLKQFMGRLTDATQQVGVGLLQKYLESKIGL
jgi:hypothetical protein